MYVCEVGGGGGDGASRWCRISRSVSSVGYRLPTYLPTSLYFFRKTGRIGASATRGFFFWKPLG